METKTILTRSACVINTVSVSAMAPDKVLLDTDIFHISPQKFMLGGFVFEALRQGASNEYPYFFTERCEKYYMNTPSYLGQWDSLLISSSGAKLQVS